ncbi:hypothetical protein DQ04_03791020 [Trypanosoma grayi]|uniref:hypothetical protein n=1 Tax=Trypanosoma grayi TaxID=71804 RepID=UPI0004F43C3A|nr:hypothetical protein DQ04_03791020 [Trypanosoma grayi]KEG10378.1 hypothetical protein DQ04_03791020 [Trypanosoma grayi]
MRARNSGRVVPWLSISCVRVIGSISVVAMNLLYDSPRQTPNVTAPVTSRGSFHLQSVLQRTVQGVEEIDSVFATISKRQGELLEKREADERFFYIQCSPLRQSARSSTVGSSLHA